MVYQGLSPLESKKASWLKPNHIFTEFVLALAQLMVFPLAALVVASVILFLGFKIKRRAFLRNFLLIAGSATVAASISGLLQKWESGEKLETWRDNNGSYSRALGLIQANAYFAPLFQDHPEYLEKLRVALLEDEATGKNSSGLVYASLGKEYGAPAVREAKDELLMKVWQSRTDIIEWLSTRDTIKCRAFDLGQDFVIQDAAFDALLQSFFERMGAAYESGKSMPRQTNANKEALGQVLTTGRYKLTEAEFASFTDVESTPDAYCDALLKMMRAIGDVPETDRAKYIRAFY